MLSARKASVIALALPAALLVSACSVGDSNVSASKVESQIKTKLASQAAQPIKAVSCPGDLKGKVGATEDCVLTLADGSKYQVHVNVTKVSDSKALFNLQVTKRIS